MELQLKSGYKSIFGMAMPIALSLIVPQFNFITNNIFLGGLGQQELASAGITGVYYLIFAVIGSGLNNGLQTLIARRAGQNLPHEIGNLFYHGIWVALVISGFGILITYFIAPFILRSAIHNAAIAEQAIQFIFIRIWGLPLLYLYVMRNALLVGTNQTNFLFWGTLAETLANIFFDYALIYGHFGMPAMGFNGAAYASVIAEATGLIVIYFVIHAKGIHKTFSMFEKRKLDFGINKIILFQSSPLILQYVISLVSWEYFYILIEHHGERALAISNSMRNIFGIAGVFSWAFAATTSAMVSNLIGQGKSYEVIPLIKRIVLVSMVCSFLMTLLLNWQPGFFISFYGQGDDFIAEAIPVVRVVSLALLFMSFSTVWLNAVTGTGNTMVNLIIEFVAIVIYVIYVYWVMEVLELSLTWGWASEWVYWISMFIMAFFYFKMGKWEKKI